MGFLDTLMFLCLIACGVMQSKTTRLLTERVANCEKMIATQHAALLCHRDALNAIKKRQPDFSMN